MQHTDAPSGLEPLPSPPPGHTGSLDAVLVRGLLHELRTPLNVLVGYSDLLAADNLDGPSRQRIQRLRAAAERLTGLLDVAADLARAAQHTVDLTTTASDSMAPVEALRIALASVATDAAGRKVVLEPMPDPRPHGEVSVAPRSRLVACVLVHAIHHSPPEAVVRTEVRGDTEVVITASVAIPPADGPAPAGQAGQRFWWQAARVLAEALGAELHDERGDDVAWRGVIRFPPSPSPGSAQADATPPAQG